MSVEILNTSVVVVAEQHNCSLLHPSFLRYQNIVPEDWTPAEPSVSTPVFASVKYENGIAFVVDEKKLQVIDDTPLKEDFFRASSYTLKYVQSLPHVHYSAIGYNIKSFIEEPAPDSRIINNFLKEGPWKSQTFNANSCGLRLIFPTHDNRFRLSIDSGILKKGPLPERTGIIVSANFHNDLVGEIPPLVDDIETIVSRFPEYKQLFIEAVKQFFGETITEA